MSILNQPDIRFVEDGWVVGWAEIIRFLGMKKPSKKGKGHTTIERLHEHYGFPLHKLPSGSPAIIKSEANAWLRHFSEVSSPFRMQKLVGAALNATNRSMLNENCEPPGKGKYEVIGGN